MSQFDRNLNTAKEAALDLRQSKIEIVLSPSEAEQLGATETGPFGMAMTVSKVDAESPLSPEIPARATIICVEVKPGSPASIGRIAQLRRDFPGLPVIAAVRDADVALARALLREGVRDVVELPISMVQLAETLGDIFAGMAGDHAKGGRHGKLITVVKSIGGVGATNVGVHLATALAEGPGQTCLFDLDVQFGNAATYLGMPSKPSLSDLLEGGGRVDGDFVKSVMATMPSGLKFLPAPPEIGPLEAIELAQLERIVAAARSEFDYIVADMPSNWSNWTLSIVAESDLIILVVNLTIASLRQGKRQLRLLLNQGVDPSRIAVLVNRVEQRLFKTIDLEDAAKALGHPVELWVRNDYALMSAANNQGLVVGDLSKKSKIAKDFVRIAEMLPARMEMKG